MLVHATTESGRRPPEVAATLDAMIVWMNEQPFAPGKSYWFKQTTRVVTGAMTDLAYAVDVNSLEHKPAAKLQLNEVGRVTLTLATPFVFDPYTINPATGGFIIIDRLTNTTVGAGMIVGRSVSADPTARGRVTQDEKELRLGQRGAVVWTTPALADAIERALFEEARTILRLDPADLPHPNSLAPLLRAAAEQALILIIASNSAPTPRSSTPSANASSSPPLPTRPPQSTPSANSASAPPTRPPRVKESRENHARPSPGNSNA